MLRVRRAPSWKGGEGRMLVCMHMRVRGFLGCGVQGESGFVWLLCMGCDGDGGAVCGWVVWHAGW